jgi:cell division protein FtsL
MDNKNSLYGMKILTDFIYNIRSEKNNYMLYAFMLLIVLMFLIYNYFSNKRLLNQNNKIKSMIKSAFTNNTELKILRQLIQNNANYNRISNSRENMFHLQ